MKMPSRLATPACVAFALCLLTSYADAAGAHTWQWQFVVQTPGGAAVNARSRVVLSAGDVSLTYTAHIHNADVPITVCRADIADIAGAQPATHDGRTFLLVKLKPPHTAACDSGSAPVAVMPVADDAALGSAVSAINAAAFALAAPTPAPPAPASSASPSPSPSPRPTATASAAPPGVHLSDWVDSDGLFAFVRVRNRDTHSATIAGGAIQNCHNVATGCGRFPGTTLAPGATATLATVMSNAQGDPATFTYRYDAQDGSARATDGGSSTKVAGGWRPPMSPQEIRSAEAGAVASLERGASVAAAPSSPRPAASPPPAFVAARLTQRGSSRLGLGHTGIAVVRVTVGADGTPQNAQIVRISDRQLAAAAIETAVSSSYAPAMRDGRPVDGTYIATFRFDGGDPSLSAIPVWKRDPSPAPSPQPT